MCEREVCCNIAPAISKIERAVDAVLHPWFNTFRPKSTWMFELVWKQPENAGGVFW